MTTALHPSEIDGLTRAEAETIASRVLREIARESFKRHRNIATATRESAQLVHLACRLDAFAKADA